MYYPLKFQYMQNSNGEIMFNVFVALIRQVVPKRLADTLGRETKQIDCRLDTFYLVPTVEIANQSLLNRIDQILTLRYALEASFSLSPTRPDCGCTQHSDDTTTQLTRRAVSYTHLTLPTIYSV